MRLETLPITARSFENDYHINGDNFEKAYKNHLSGFREWTELDHAEGMLNPHTFSGEPSFPLPRLPLTGAREGKIINPKLENSLTLYSQYPPRQTYP